MALRSSFALCLALIPGVLGVACAGGVRPVSPPSFELDPIQTVLAGREVVYAHVVSTVAVGDTVDPTRPFGIVEAFPAVESAGHQDLLIAARRHYDEGRYLDAVHVLGPAFADEFSNPFILNEYARALFRVDSLRPASREIYERLVTILTSRQEAPPGALVVDMWFVDAYWKLALLYLDIGEYRRAFVELLKVAVTRPSGPILEQLYGYFAEASFHLGDHAAADWFIAKTLAINAGNEYVLQFRKAR